MLTYSFEDRQGKSKFEYLYEQIREDILKGTLKPGEKLPSKRALAEHLGISVITVEGAYGQLLDEGYIVSRPRSGFFVSEISLPSGSIAPDIPQTVELQNVGSGRLPREETTGASGDFPVSPFLRLIREVLNDYGDKLLRRPPNAGCPELREAISAYLERYRGMKTEPEQIIIGSGSEYLYGLIAQLIDPGTIFALEEESYEKIRLVYRAHGIRCELLPMDADGISAEGLRHSQAGLLHVTPFHSYPTGVTAPAAKRYEYISWANARRALIVEDDFESEFSVQRKPLETLYSMDSTGSVIYLNTFTKSIAPSMRVGYMVLPKRLLRRYRNRIGFYSCTVPSLDQYVLAEYISRGYFEKRLNHIRRKLRART